MGHRLRILRAVALTLASSVLPAARCAAQEAFLPDCLLGLGGGSKGHALVVDKELEKLFLFEGNGERPPRLVRAWNATTGKSGGNKAASGDHKTPVGIYFFTKVLEDQQLPAEYGARAFVLDYPNRFDARKGKTGSGIWLHATDEAVRPFTSMRTRGCVVVTNRDVLDISRYVRLNETPIVVEEKVARLTPEAWRKSRGEVVTFLDSWRRAWTTGDMGALADHYARDFRAEGKDRAAWLAHKAAVVSSAGPVVVSVVAPTVLATGDEAIVRFGQVYRSELKTDYGLKTLWLVREDGAYRILDETWEPQAATAEALALLGAPLPVAEVARAGTAPGGDAGGIDLASSRVRSDASSAGLLGEGTGEGTAASEPEHQGRSAADRGAPTAARSSAVVPRDREPVQAVSSPAQNPPAAAPDGSRARVAPDTASRDVAPPLASPVELSDFLADLGGGEVRVSFRLSRLGEEAAPATGRVFVLVRTRTRSGTRVLAWPRGTRLESGEPVSFESGDWFGVRRFKLVEAVLPASAPDTLLEGASVLVYDASGHRLFRQDFGG